MAWIESHQELRHHYKTKRLARELKVTVAAAIGHLHCLWWWAIDFAPDGDLSKFDDYEIADAIGYEGKDPAKAKAALIFAGFLDNKNDGTITIHDWYDYSGQLGDKRIESRKKERDRKAEYRARKKAEADAGRDKEASPAPVPQQEAYCPDFVPRDSPAENGTVPPIQYSTGQDSTGQDTTVQGQDRKTLPSPPASGGTGAGAEPDAQERRFEQFWAIYPKKQGKGDALKVWKRLKPDKALFEQILESVKAHASRNPQWKRDGGQYIPNPATWLRQTRWLDEIPAQEGGAANAGRKTERIGGADGYADFQRSTGFRSADSDTDADN